MISFECFDVDHTQDPATKRACPLDNVAIACFDHIDCTRPPVDVFVTEVCSMGSQTPQPVVARIDGIYAEEFEAYVASEHGEAFDIIGTPQFSTRKEIKSFSCLRVKELDFLATLLQKFWVCGGGSWFIVGNCRDDSMFVENCERLIQGKIDVSDARDNLVHCGDIAAVTFDDDILDIVTERFSSEQLRTLIGEVASNHGIDIQES